MLGWRGAASRRGQLALALYCTGICQYHQQKPDKSQAQQHFQMVQEEAEWRRLEEERKAKERLHLEQLEMQSYVDNVDRAKAEQKRRDAEAAQLAEVLASGAAPRLETARTARAEAAARL